MWSLWPWPDGLDCPASCGFGSLMPGFRRRELWTAPISDGEPDLSWLADAPMFIDGQQIDAFYDAVVGPAFRTVELQISATQTEQREKSAGTRLGAGLSALFPWLKVNAEIDARTVATSGRNEADSIVVQPVESAARKLVELTLHYLVNQQDRICVVGQGVPLPASADIATSPRMIAFVDTPPGTKFLPQAAELNDGRVVTFFNPLVESLKVDRGMLPVGYPHTTATERANFSAMLTGPGSPSTGTPTRRSKSSRMLLAMEDARVGSTTARPSQAARRCTFMSSPAATTTPEYSPITSFGEASGTGWDRGQPQVSASPERPRHL